MQVEVDLIAIAHQKRMEAIANRHCRLNNATSVVRHIFGNRRAFAFLGNALQKRYFRNNIDWPLSHFLSCKLQPSGDLFSIKISEFFLTSQTSLKKSLVHLESFWKELKLQKVCVCCKTSAAGNKMLCHCNFPSDVGLLLSKRSFWCTLELTSETLLSAPRKLTHFCLENSTSQTLKVFKN